MEKYYCIQCLDNSMIYDEKRQALTCEKCKTSVAIDIYTVSLQQFYKNMAIAAFTNRSNRLQYVCVRHNQKLCLVGLDQQGQLQIIFDNTLVKEDQGKVFKIQTN